MKINKISEDFAGGSIFPPMEDLPQGDNVKIFKFPLIYEELHRLFGLSLKNFDKNLGMARIPLTTLTPQHPQ